MNEKIVVPYAPILVESTRSIGYSFEAALADIIDNSISASAKEIHVSFMSQEPQWLRIDDDGWGMSAEELENAMRYGSQSSTDVRRKDDLGRFGLGLKMASLSQCRKLTVITKQEGYLAGACWDLDYIQKQGTWALIWYTEAEIKAMPDYSVLISRGNGTIVRWEQFDRMKQGAAKVDKAFDEKIEIARKHVALVFHRFLNDENIRNRLTITFNGEAVTGIDPFLTKHPATQPLPEQILRIDREEIRVKPYVLPYVSKLSKLDFEAVGGKDELRQQQGFYIYRNRRLIIWGTWFRLIKQNELGKLARVRVDIPNSLDSIWEIDIKKSTAWDADFRIVNGKWVASQISTRKTPPDWAPIKNEENALFMKNAYRVLLTRARQGFVIFIPEGNKRDVTRKPEYYDTTFEYLKSLGIPVI